MYKGELLECLLEQSERERTRARKGIAETAVSCLRCLQGLCPLHAIG